MLLSGAIVCLDLWLKDLSISLLVVTVVALTLGATWRDRAWQWGLLTGITVPGGNLVSRTIHHDPLLSGLTYYLIALIPAFVGAYMGAFLNKMVSALRGKED